MNTGGESDNSLDRVVAGARRQAALGEWAFEMLRPNGAATVIGMVPVGEKVEDDGESLQYEKRLQGSNMGSNRFRVDMPRCVDIYLAGNLHPDEMITQRIRLDPINEAFDAMQAGEVARSVIVFD